VERWVGASIGAMEAGNKSCGVKMINGSVGVGTELRTTATLISKYGAAMPSEARLGTTNVSCVSSAMEGVTENTDCTPCVFTRRRICAGERAVGGVRCARIGLERACVVVVAVVVVVAGAKDSDCVCGTDVGVWERESTPYLVAAAQVLEEAGPRGGDGRAPCDRRCIWRDS
jgi:hypothetical protein